MEQRTLIYRVVIPNYFFVFQNLFEKNKNNRDMALKALHTMSEWVSLWHLSNYREAELLKKLLHNIDANLCTVHWTHEQG